jgi:hypothetical protein
MRWSAIGIVGSLAMLLACRAHVDGVPAPTPATTCAPNEVEVHGTCVLRLDACDLGVPIAGGGCTKVGVPEDGCGDAFKSDGQGGCTPILPSAECPDGSIAVPGDTTCAPLRACGSDPYGAPDPGPTLFVDAAYAGSASDGTKTQPFKTIGAAVIAANSSERTTIAIAAGTYAEDVRVDKRVHLRGRCPEMVRIEGVGTTVDDGAIYATDEVEVSGLTVAGGAQGILLNASAKLHDLAVVDTTIHGILAGGPSAVVSIERVRLERAGACIGVFRGTVTIDRALLLSCTDTGISMLGVLDEKPTLTMHHVRVTKSRSAGIYILGGTATIEDTLVTASKSTTKDPGYGLIIGTSDKYPAAASLTIRRSALLGNGDTALATITTATSAPATVVVERCTLADSRPVATVAGLLVGGVGANVTVRESLLARCPFAGMLVTEGTLTAERCLVRDTVPVDGVSVGVLVSFVDEDPSPGHLVLRESRIQAVSGIGVAVIGGEATVEGCAVTEVTALPDGSYGDGLSVTAGIDASGVTRASSLSIDSTRVWNAKRAAVSTFAATLAVSRSTFACTGFPIEVNRKFASGAVARQGDFSLSDGGGNICGCPSSEECTAQSDDLAPIPATPPKRK